MKFPALPGAARLFGVVCLLALGACDQPLDFDLRGNFGGFSTAGAATGATASRPKPDSRGVISYPNYQVVVSRRGDTASDIAARLGLDAGELARYNGVGENVNLHAGEVLALPRKVGTAEGGVDIASLAGAAIDNAADTTPVVTTNLGPAAATSEPGPEPVRHKVNRGETVYTISRLYRVPVKSLAEWNGLGPDFAIREGQVLLIPVRSQNPPRQAAAVVTQPGQGSPTPEPPSASTPLPEKNTVPAEVSEPVVNPVGKPSKPSRTAMAFPVRGKIVRAYSKGRNDGIDIAAAPRSAVGAAADGTVAAITSDADQIPIIVVRHPDNLLTVYANVDKIAVAKGDKVKRGQKLAVLRTGEDAYVHFEVREGFDSVDPMPYLK